MYQPFDLEKAKAGCPVRTVQGLPVRMICFDRENSGYPLIGLVTVSDTETVIAYWTLDGVRNIRGQENNLVMDIVKTDRWVNIYRDEDMKIYRTSGPLHASHDEAFKARGRDCGYTATIKLEWTE